MSIEEGFTRAEALAALRTAFRDKGLPTPELDARFLLRGCIGPAVVLDHAQALALHAAAERRLAGEPVDRILGDAEFWSLRFLLNRDTLSPRADTESVVDLCLTLTSERDAPSRFLDIGTGTGAILIALLSERKAATGIGIDISESAARMARENARLNAVANRSHFAVGNWANAVAGLFDVIVSNPPYIPSAAIAGLALEVRDHDPLRALDGGFDGLEAYRALAPEISRLLTPDGSAVLEIGAGQGQDVVAIMEEAGLRTGPSRADLGGHLRALAFHRAR